MEYFGFKQTPNDVEGFFNVSSREQRLCLHFGGKGEV